MTKRPPPDSIAGILLERDPRPRTLREITDEYLADLTPHERQVLKERFGLSKLERTIMDGPDTE